MANTSSTCVHCQAPLSRPGARFCPRCGKAQPEIGEEATVAAKHSPAEAATVVGLPAAQVPPSPETPASGAQLVIQDGSAVQTVELGEQPRSLGRLAENDIQINSRFVSGRHARVEPLGKSHQIVDVGSTNGLLYEGQRVERHELADGDVLRIGDPATGNYVTLTYTNRAAKRVRQAATAQRIILNPNDPQITIGRVGCDIVLDNPQVSRFHAQIDRTPEGKHILRDAGSTNGTFINGQRITVHPLVVGEIIQIGAFKFVYTGERLDEYDQSGDLRIDARGLTRVVGKGKIILNDVSISIAPREFVAIVGGSGTGKSTLVKALCAYAPADKGTVLINGDDFYRNFDAYRTVLGYVPQDDIIHRPLPVERALQYAARLRLPADTDTQEIERRVDQVLEQVEMIPSRTNQVESLSGGQRKRVSIGVELLADPSLFFLDEPTSGLDPGLEKKMMYTLRNLADSGRTVVIVTHATANITQCDHVAFMGTGGRLVFFGPPSAALAFFGVSSNDFADIYTKLEGPADPNGPVVQRDLSHEYSQWQRENPQASGPPSLGELWERKFRAAPDYQRWITDRLATAPPAPVITSVNPKNDKAPKVSLGRQFGILTRRYADLTLQDRRNLWILLLQAPIIALLLMLVAQPDALTGVLDAGFAQRGEAKKVLFMLATVGVWFGIINAAREIAKEAPIFRRERLVNLHLLPYLASKVSVLSGLVLLQSLILLGLLSLRLSIPLTSGVILPAPLELFITVLLTSLAGATLGLVISAFASTPDRAISIVPLALIPQILFAGLIFRIEGIATPLSWLTISRWSMDALGISTNINTMCNLPNLDDRGRTPPGCGPGFLETEAAFTHTPEALLLCWGALAAHIVIGLAITGWWMRRRDQQT